MLHMCSTGDVSFYRYEVTVPVVIARCVLPLLPIVRDKVLHCREQD